MTLVLRTGKLLNRINPFRTAREPSIFQYEHLPTDASAALLSVFPQELVDEILSYISKQDIRQLSSCCKYWRPRTIPKIFHRVIWRSVNDAGLFNDGGILAHVRPVVRQVSMYLTCPVKDVIEMIETYRIWMEVFGLLPNVRDLQMDLYMMNELEGILVRSILTKISTSPAFETLQSLKIERMLIRGGSIHDLPRPHISSFISTSGIYTDLPLGVRECYEILPPKTQDFLGPLDCRTRIPIPKSLTKLGVSLNQFNLVPSLHSSQDLNDLVHVLSGSIRELRIMADRFIHPQDPDLPPDIRLPNFSSLTRLTIINEGYLLHHLTEIGNWAPNLQILAVSIGTPKPYRHRDPNLLALSSGQEHLLCKAIQKLKALKRIRLPWLCTYADPFNIGIDNLDHWWKSYFKTERLDSLVGQWVKSGSSKLEKVTFVTEYFSSKGRDDKMLRVNILRGVEFEGGWKLESQQDNDYMCKPFHRDISV